MGGDVRWAGYGTARYCRIAIWGKWWNSGSLGVPEMADPVFMVANGGWSLHRKLRVCKGLRYDLQYL